MAKFPVYMHTKPMARWPLAWHCGLAVVGVLLLAGLARYAVGFAAHQANQARQAATNLQAQSVAAQKHTSHVSKPDVDFTTVLSNAEQADDVLRDIARHAQRLGLVVTSLNLSPQSATERSWGQVQITFASTGSYSAHKTLLVELTGRYPNMGLHSLSLRATDATGVRLQGQTALMLYLKN